MRIWVQEIRDYSFCPELWRLNKENGAYQPESYNESETDLMLKVRRDTAELLAMDESPPPRPDWDPDIIFGKRTKVIVTILSFLLLLYFFPEFFVFDDVIDILQLLLMYLLFFWFVLMVMGFLYVLGLENLEIKIYRKWYDRKVEKWKREVKKWYERRVRIYSQIISDNIRLIQSGRLPLSQTISVGDRNVELIADEFDLEVDPEELEVEINRLLEERGVEVVDNYSEYIIQLAGETPSSFTDLREMSEESKSRNLQIHVTRALWEQVEVNVNIKYQTITVTTKPKQPIPDYVPFGYGYDLVEAYVKMSILRNHLNELAESIKAEVRYPNWIIIVKESPLLKQYLVQIVEKIVNEETENLLVNPHRCRICPKRNDCSFARVGRDDPEKLKQH